MRGKSRLKTDRARAADPKKVRRPSLEARRSALVLRARENPHEFFSFEECGLILGFGTSAMGHLNAAGAPVAFRKMNPALICRWIAENPALVSKTGLEDEES